jgi:Fur family ferric uptake transcriptional regulator
MIKIRQTKQKELLSEEVKKFKSFFTAEELLIKAKKKDSRLGIATVYRFLSDLTNKREIHSYVCDRKTIYSMEDNIHCHFTCEKCGKVEHIKFNSLDFIKNKVKGSICHFQIDIFGTCESCYKE